jgi:hypothetical protein
MHTRSRWSEEDERYQFFLDRTTEREVLGLRMPVAAAQDVLQGKIWAIADSERPARKRQMDLFDIARLVEPTPELRELVPPEIADRLNP